MQTPPPKRTGWSILFTGAVVGLSVAAVGCFAFGVSIVVPAIVFGLLVICIGFNWVLFTLLDRWRR